MLCFTEPPSAPCGPLKVSNILKNSLTISWQLPAFDGGSPITGYLIEKRDTQIAGWILVDSIKPNIYSYDINGLIEGHRYSFRVCAENRLGRSLYLDTTEFVTAKSPYGEHAFSFNCSRDDFCFFLDK